VTPASIFIPGNFLAKRITGTQRYATEMTKGLIAAKAPVRVLLTKDMQLPDWLPVCRCEIIPSLGSGRMAQFFTFWFLAPLILVWRYQLSHYYVWSPCNVGSPLYLNHIITIHDMAVHENPRWFSLAFVLFYRICFTVLSLGGNTVITVSQFSASEILRYYRGFGSKIAVIPNGMDSVENEVVQRPSRLVVDRPFILCVASKDPRKNLRFVVDSWLENSLGRNEILIMVGGGSSIFRNDAIVESSGAVVDLGYVSEGELAWLYRNCKAVVQASSYEGFGLPIIEARMRGAFVICSDIPAFREVAGDSAWYYKVGDCEGLINAITRSLSEKSTSSFSIKFQSWDTVAMKFYLHVKSLILFNKGVVV
jgi:glycosyltransferase involved in cell wall biosynthesis